MRALALALGIPGSALAIATLELTRVPAGGDPVRLLGAWLHLLQSAARSFVLPAGLLLVTLLLVDLVGRADGRARRWGVVGLVGLAFAQSALAREGLIAYAPFAWHLGAHLAFAALTLGLVGLHLALAFGERRPRAAAALGALVITASLALAHAHYLVYVGLYPTLHQCVLKTCFVAVALGIALTLRGLSARPGLALAPALSLFALALLLEPPASAWARPVVTAYTELGRGDGVTRALRERRAELLPTALPRAARAVAPDPRAEARFASQSGLPELAFSLDDHDVLIVMADATRHDRTSLARGRDGPTPALAALARRSQRFDRAYAPSNGTFPTVASMFAMAPLSWSPVDLRRRHWRGRLRRGRQSAIEAMRAAGRDTFWVGHDLEGSFSDHAEGLERGFSERTLIAERRGDPADAVVDRRIADRAVAAIGARDGRRWLGWVFFVSPHDDYRVHDRSAPHATPLERYDQELAAMDAQLGRLLEAVDLERTIIVFAGDHGEAFSEHGHTRHLSSVYDEQIHVPLVVHVPGAAPARHAAPTSLTYVLPWLMLRGSGAERAAARRALREDLGPWMRALDGAVVSEMIGRRAQAAAIVDPDQTVVYDLLADLPRLFDASDRGQRVDLRESSPRRYARALTRVRAYRRLRLLGRRFRFAHATEDP